MQLLHKLLELKWEKTNPTTKQEKRNPEKERIKNKTKQN